MGRSTIDLTGQEFGRLTVVDRYPGQTPKRESLWRCRCECGGETVVKISNLRTGNTRSCGCQQQSGLHPGGEEHGLSKTPEYKCWRAMWQRCTNPKAKAYKDYGGRGISVCERWRSFRNFYADMGPKPHRKLTIERNDNDGNYEPGNCRWAMPVEQAANRRPRKDGLFTRKEAA